jgi:predicted SprT family Zn-dependent metalloprotease
MYLHPVERPGIGTMAVDKHGRLYWDPKYLEQTGDEALPTTVLHEVLHLYLRHHSRLWEALEDHRLEGLASRVQHAENLGGGEQLGALLRFQLA